MKQLLIILVTLVLCYTGLAQGDAPKYSTVSGYGFKYKRQAWDSVGMVPLSTSPHTPYRAGGIRWSVTDSTFEGYTGSQWLKLLPFQNTDSSFIFMGDTIVIRGTGGGGATIDTTSLSNRINAKADQTALVDSAADIRAAIAGATGSPGGIDGDVQYNNAGAFAGAFPWNSTLKRATMDSLVAIKLRSDTLRIGTFILPNLKNWWFFGTSITNRFGLVDTNTAWINQVASYYGKYVKNKGVDGAVIIKSTPLNPFGGQNMIDYMQANLLTKTAADERLFLAFGENDFNVNSVNYTPTAYRLAYDSVINFAISKGYSLTDITIVGPGYIDTVTNSTATRLRQIDFNDTLRTFAANKGVMFVDIWAKTFSQSMKYLYLPQTTVTHPGPEGHSVYADLVKKSLGDVIVLGGQRAIIDDTTEVRYIKVRSVDTPSISTRPLGVAPGGRVIKFPLNYFIPNDPVNYTNGRIKLNGDIFAKTVSPLFLRGGTGARQTGYTGTAWEFFSASNIAEMYAFDQTAIAWRQGSFHASNFLWQIQSNTAFQLAMTSGGALESTQNNNSLTYFSVGNNNTGTIASAEIRVGPTSTSGSGGALRYFGTGFTPNGIYTPSSVMLEAGPTTATTMAISASNSAGVLKFYTGGILAANERARIAADGQLSLYKTLTGTNAMRFLVKGSDSAVYQVDASALAPSLSNTQIAIGNSSNQISGSSKLKYIDSITRFIAPSVYANYHTSVGDSTLQKVTTKTGVFYGDSYVAATTINPAYIGQATQIANLTNVFEQNRGIGGTRMVSQSGTDSSMENRIYTIPSYSAAIDYIYLYYGTNDATTLAIDTATFRSVSNKVLDSIITNRGYPLNKIYVQSNGYFINSNPTIQARIQQFATITEDLAIKKGVVSINSYKAMVASGGATLLTSDSVHANERGIEVIVGAAMDKIKGGGTARVNGTLNTNGINVYQFANPVNASLFTGYDTTHRPVVEIRGKYNGTNTESFGVGLNTLKSITTGQYNVALGTSALTALTTGTGNVALGSQSLLSNLIGNSNTAIGMQSLRLATGNENTAVGRGSATAVTTGQQNTAIGFEALNTVSTGSLNSALGYFALHENTASNNAAFGASALRNNTSGTNNVAMGLNSLFSNLTGSGNTGVGVRSLRGNTGSNNTGIGFQSGDSLTSASANTLIGYQSGYRSKAVLNNTFIGYQSGRSNTTGSYNTFIGGYLGKDTGLNQQIGVADGEGDLFLYADMNTLKGGVFTDSPTEALDVNGKIRARTISTQATPDSIAVITEGVIEKSSMAALLTALGIDAGEYTPTLTIIANADAVSLISTHYLKTKDQVFVDIAILIDPTLISTTTNVDITLPFASTMTNFTNLTGNVTSGDGVNGNTVAVGNKCRVGFTSTGTTSTTYNIHFAYTIQ